MTKIIAKLENGTTETYETLRRPDGQWVVLPTNATADNVLDEPVNDEETAIDETIGLLFASDTGVDGVDIVDQTDSDRK